MLAISCWATFAAVNEMFPVPLAGSPMAGLGFSHAKVAPGLPERATLTGAPAQAVTGAGAFALGVGRTVMLKLCPLP
ncbi:MAG: hypothetical protein KIS77_21340 [Saprospiraceae bacterium]|nr:hypothetical protein [Saprospiraceae bacterium]